MKSIFNIAMILAFVAISASCKKEVEPTLTITARDTAGLPLADVTVITDPCFFDQSNCDVDRLNSSFRKEAQTDNNGQVVFEYPYSAVLDVIVLQSVTDSNGDTTDVMCGQNVVSIETKELKKDGKNEYETSVIVNKVIRDGVCK